MVRQNRLVIPFIVFICSLGLLLINLGKPEIYILDEAKNAECAREMYVSGDYVVPYFNGQLRTDKPPLHYFFMAASYKMFGVSAFSSRFFSVVFGALTILVVHLFARKYLNDRAAVLSSMVLLSSLHFNLQMRLAVPDPYLIFWMTSTFMTFYLFIREGKKYWLYLMYLAMGLGILTKGPIAIALPGLVMLIFLLMSRRFNWPVVRSFQIPLGILIVLAVALPWYWMNYQATQGVWLDGFLFKHNLGRFSDTMEGHGGFFLLPLLMVIVGLFPMGAFSISSAIVVVKERKNDFLLLNLLVVGVIVIFFSFSQTKLPNYTAPAYPFMAIMLGYYLDRLMSTRGQERGVRNGYIFYTIVAVAIPVGVYFGLKADKSMFSYSYLWIYFVVLPIGALIGWYFIIKRNWNSLIRVTIASFILTNILFFAKAYPEVYKKNPVNSSLHLLENRPHLVYYGIMNPAYIFNLRRVIPSAGSMEELKVFLQKHPGAAVISRKSYKEEIESQTGLKPIFEQKDTFENPTTIIFE